MLELGKYAVYLIITAQSSCGNKTVMGGLASLTVASGWASFTISSVPILAVIFNGMFGLFDGNDNPKYPSVLKLGLDCCECLDNRWARHTGQKVGPVLQEASEH